MWMRHLEGTPCLQIISPWYLLKACKLERQVICFPTQTNGSGIAIWQGVQTLIFRRWEDTGGVQEELVRGHCEIQPETCSQFLDWVLILLSGNGSPWSLSLPSALSSTLYVIFSFLCEMPSVWSCSVFRCFLLVVVWRSMGFFSFCIIYLSF